MNPWEIADRLDETLAIDESSEVDPSVNRFQRGPEGGTVEHVGDGVVTWTQSGGATDGNEILLRTISRLQQALEQCGCACFHLITSQPTRTAAPPSTVEASAWLLSLSKRS